MALVDKWLDGPEPELSALRASTRTMYTIHLVFVALVAVGLLGFLAFGIFVLNDLPDVSFLPFLALMFGIQALATVARETYKRRQLEERVKDLEARLKSKA